MANLDQFRAALRAMEGQVVAFESATLLSVLAELRRGDVSDQRLRALQRPGSSALAGATRPILLPAAKSGKSVAVIGVRGIATYDLDFQPFCFSSVALSRAVTQAAVDPGIEAVVLDIDSPGGYVTGTQEAADAIFAARKKKRVTALVNPLAASAAYWLASQADTIIGVPSADVGSIGVFMCHYDFSAALADAGIRPTFIYAGDHKTEGNPTQPLGAEAKAFYQAEINKTHRDFVGAVARGRGTSAETVRMTFGKGRCLSARDALKLGMIDAIAPPDQAMQSMIAGSAPSRSTPSASAGYWAIIEEEARQTPLPGDRFRAILEEEARR